MTGDLIDIVRRMAKEIAGLRLRLAQTIISGTVTEVRGDRVRLNLGTDDRPVPSPLVRIARASGHAGGGVSAYTRPGIGEPMLLITPGGRVGEHSRAIPGGPVDDHPAPGAAETDGEVTGMGRSRICVRDGEILIECGKARVHLTPDGLKIDAGNVAVKGDALSHNGKNVGDSHIHGGVFPGGATTDVPAN